MRITVIAHDGYVSIDGVDVFRVDLTFLPEEVHAIQWYDTFGEVEYADPVTKNAIRNEPISSFTPYQPVLEAYYAKQLQDLADAEAAEQAAQATQTQEVI